MCWVSWDRICQSKEKGGLGIKNLALFNASLLCKWKWRSLTDIDAPWLDLLRFRYGSLAANFLSEDGSTALKQASIWWRDIWNLGCMADGGWFRNNISSVIGDGNDISFWKEKWIGAEPLRDYVPALFNISRQQDYCIAAMGKWERDVWRWQFKWASDLSTAEVDLLHDLKMVIDQVQPRRDIIDRRKWIPHGVGLFSVQSAYSSLMDLSSTEALESNTALALKKLWKTKVPSKASIFGWRLLLAKLPTKVALFDKGIITSNFEKCCVFCSTEAEDIQHVFLNCNLIVQVWNSIFNWLGSNIIVNASVSEHFLTFGGILKGKKTKGLRHIIWVATTWCIWRFRNNILFRGASVNISSLFNHIFNIAWLWFIGSLRRDVDFSFLDWCNNPLACFHRI
jgi:hypothetical protein